MHTGHLEKDCPLCKFQHMPGYEAVWANLMGLAAPARASKPRLSIDQIAAQRSKCIELKAAGLPCPDDPVRLAPLMRPIVRNICYYIYPLRGGIWRWNAAMLRDRLPLFNGKRIVYIAHGPETDPPASVRFELDQAGLAIDYIEAHHDPSRREVAGFLPMFERVHSLSPNETVTYAHAKGVSRARHPTVMRWTAMMYVALMDYWPAVESVLDRYPIAGCFKKHGAGWAAHESRCQHHYSGTFYTFRAREVFSRNWKRMDSFYSAMETWPGNVFTDAEAGVVFHEDLCRTDRQLYQVPYFDGVVVPAWEKWQAEHAHQQTECPT